MIWRRLPLVLTISIVGVLTSFYLIVSSPRIYEASAVIQLDMPAAIDQGTDSSLPAARRVQLIEQRLMARANLREVIERLDLFSNTPQLSEAEKRRQEAADALAVAETRSREAAKLATEESNCMIVERATSDAESSVSA